MRIFEELDLSICIHNVLAENLWHCTGTTSPSECLAKQYTEDIGFVGFWDQSLVSGPHVDHV